MKEPSSTAADSIFGEIEITGIPGGFAPRKIRELWIGVRIPCMWREDRKKNPAESFGPGWVVSQDEAIEALGKRSPEARDWWLRAGFPEPGDGAFFHFDLGCARETKRVLPRVQVIAAVLRQN